jgi:hypothetical protein
MLALLDEWKGNLVAALISSFASRVCPRTCPRLALRPIAPLISAAASLKLLTPLEPNMTSVLVEEPYDFDVFYPWVSDRSTSQRLATSIGDRGCSVMIHAACPSWSSSAFDCRCRSLRSGRTSW